MKSLFKIISRYSVTAGMIIGVILISNIAVFVAVGYHNILREALWKVLERNFIRKMIPGSCLTQGDRS